MGKKEKQQVVIETETTDIVEVKEVEKAAVRCELRIGLDENGSIYFNIHGTDQSLITISGLLRYAEEEQKRIWENRLTNRS